MSRRSYNRIVEECNVPFGDESHIIYVNGTYRGNDPLGDLMHDFHCKKADDMKNKILAERARYLKESGKMSEENQLLYQQFFFCFKYFKPFGIIKIIYEAGSFF
ncbi:MAG: hypothetical protein K6E51_11325 [Treponema sp.]|nr:hypothetical protein [Treponema sp.]